MIRHLVLLLTLLGGIVCGCGRSRQSVVETDSMSLAEQNDKPAVADVTAKTIMTADSLLETLTLRQRISQCFIPSITTSADSITMRQLREYISDLNVGGVLLFNGDLVSAAAIGEACASADVPLFCAIDAEWGLGMRLIDAPDFPRNGRLGPRADEDVLYDYGREVARECRRVGINMVLGPVIDVVDNPSGVIGSRSFGQDPVRVADLGVAYARGLESGNVISVAKHFPGHGSMTGDTHREMQVIHRSLHQLDSVDLYPFKSYIDAGLSGIMVGHLAVPAIDPENRPAAVSDVVIKDLLREELGFGGLVLTDAFNMGGARGYDASAALTAGADIIIAPVDTRAEIERVLRKVKNGEMDSSVIDDKCRRILFYKVLSGLFEMRSRPNPDGIREDIAAGADSLYRRLIL
ncbi:MAG: glycoside hydrolase family 3 protein [Bacteroides sp.]|nr:glycoside hydrolase family 3 protein [Bacteroides sp.]